MIALTIASRRRLAAPAASVLAFGLALAAGAPRIAPAQPATVDEGSFTISRGGTRLGREEFRIVRETAGGAATVTARGVAVYGDRRLAPSLQTGGDSAPQRYQVEVRRGAAVEQRLTGQTTTGTHFNVQAQLDGGEAAREYLLERGTVLLDDDLYHQYYFVAQRGAARGAAVRVPVLAPRRNQQFALWVTADGSDRLTLGGQSVDARHLVLTDRVGGRRELWVDAQGRVLRVLLAAEGIEALREDPPR